jgi:heat-inducible transcriptional repressor
VGTRSAVEEILRRAAQVLGVLTQELGVAVAPALDQVVMERLELVQVSSERLLLVFNLRSGVVRTIFVEVPGLLPAASVQQVAQILNERLSGLTLQEIRGSLPERLRDASGPADGRELLNIFIAEGDELFDLTHEENGVVLGSAQMLADQPEFASNSRMRDLLRLTEGRDLLKQALESRRQRGLSITIGAENPDARLSDFTLVTSSYEVGALKGVIGVMGPTRMPYDKIIGLVEHTSRMVEGLLE